MNYFAALEIPDEIKSNLNDFSKRIYDKNLFNGNLVRKENIHLTLKFFGKLGEGELGKIKHGLNKIKFGKFKCRLGKAGVFGENFIRVLWVELLSKNLEKLHNEIDEKTPDIEENYKNFVPHVTLARIRKTFDKEKLLQEMGKIKTKEEFEAKEFVLMKSEFSSEGVKYRIVERFPFE